MRIQRAFLRFVGVGGLAVLALTSTSRVTAEQAAPSVPPAWIEPFEAFRVIGNIYYVGTADLASFLITSTEGHILIDSGVEESAKLLLASIAKLGFNARDIKVLLNTQAHYDHAAGLAALKGISGAAMVASEGDRPELESGDRDDYAFGNRYRFPPVKVDRVIRHGETVAVGSSTLTAHMTPGHSKGTTTWTTVVRDGGRDYNVVFAGSTSVVTDTVRNNPKYPTLVADYQKTFATLRALPVDVFLSQHGAAYGLIDKAKRLRAGATPNPFIDPAGYKRWLDTSEAVFRKVSQ